VIRLWLEMPWGCVQSCLLARDAPGLVSISVAVETNVFDEFTLVELETHAAQAPSFSAVRGFNG
jgi:hypothetical protein